MMSEIKLRNYQENSDLREGVRQSKLGNHYAAGPHRMTEEGVRSLQAAAADGRNWKGGDVGDEYARVLCPKGFVREYHFYFGLNNRRQVVMDFALVGGKLNVELDGPAHLASSEEDARRDAELRILGWRVVRITHL